MNDTPSQKMTTLAELCAALNLPEPEPLTEEQRREFDAKMDRADADLAAMLARREAA
ncbi:hypothetical protein AB0J83_42460 [Actinoplanes sp. NPDC049596]|uniref:hypothetical protein n=1 Tax=unclassified Actinoplanes TaxID=2626549 RepID=UPI00341307D1